MLLTWSRPWNKRTKNPVPPWRSRSDRSRGATYRPGVEVLEDRTLLSFAAAVNFSVGATPTSVASGDLNGDGRRDLVVANSGTNNVSVLLNNGAGTFQAAVNYSVGLAPRAVAVGDFNADGQLDLVTANSLGNSVSVLKGNGDGTFQAAVNLSTGWVPYAVVVADLNADGKIDLVTANSLGNSVSVLLGNGNGTFQNASDFGTGLRPVSVALGDFNADGQRDLVTANYLSDDVSVLLGNGDGTFQSPVSYNVGSKPRAVVMADFNNDGNQDLATANRGSNDVSVLLGNGDGTFQSALTTGVGADPRSLALGDFNGDGRLDLVTANKNSNTVSLLLGLGNGVFVPVSLPLAFGSQPYSVIAEDFTGDGKLDLAVANRGSNTVSLLAGQGNVLTHFGVTAPGSSVAGTPFMITVTALDALNATDPFFTLPVHLTSSDGTAVLPGDSPFQLSDAGTRTFSVILRTAGNQTITVTDSEGQFVGTATVNVTPAPISQLLVTGSPGGSTAGMAGSFTVTAQDAFGNTVTDYTGTVSFGSSDGQAVLPANYTFGSADYGTHDFQVILATAGSQWLSATDGALSAFTGSHQVTVSPTLSLGGADEVFVGMPYRLDLVTSNLGTDQITSWTVNWGDSTVETFTGNPNTVTHVYTRGPKVHTITALANDVTGSLQAANTVRVRVLVPKITISDSRKVEGGRQVTFRVDGIEATLTASENDADGVTVFEAVYSDDPTGREAQGLVFYDLMVDSADDDTTMTATFRFPEGAIDPVLKFFDETTQTYQVVRGSTGGANSLFIDRVRNVIQVTFDRTSFPSIRNLGGTVFTITVASTTPTTTDLIPAVALADTGSRSNTLSDAATASSLVRTTTFVSTNQLTLALSAAQDSQQTTSRALLGGTQENAGEVLAAREQVDEAAWLRLLMDLLEDVPQWLQQFRDAQGLQQWLQPHHDATEAVELIGEEALSEVGLQSQRDAVETLFRHAVETFFADSLPAAVDPTAGDDLAVWLEEPAPTEEAGAGASARWALAASLVCLAYRERPVRTRANNRRPSR